MKIYIKYVHTATHIADMLNRAVGEQHNIVVLYHGLATIDPYDSVIIRVYNARKFEEVSPGNWQPIGRRPLINSRDKKNIPVQNNYLKAVAVPVLNVIDYADTTTPLWNNPKLLTVNSEKIQHEAVSESMHPDAVFNKMHWDSLLNQIQVTINAVDERNALLQQAIMAMDTAVLGT